MKKNKFSKWIGEWKKEISTHKDLMILSILIFIIAIIVSFIAGNYVDKAITTPVNDLILDHIPTLNIGFLFVYGIIAILVAIAIYTIFIKVKDFHIVLSQFSLLILVRSFFIILTHLEKPINALPLNHLPKIYDFFNFYNDLFFSNHTAMTFMAFLIFRKEKIGIFFLIATFVMAVTVLFAHVHYSIDVFASFFITYGIYKFGNWLFSKLDKKRK